MYQLRILIGRTNVSSDPIHKFNESDDFLKLITTSHILVAALQILKMDDLNDIPHVPYMENPQDFWMETADKRKPVLQTICKEIAESIGFQFNTIPGLSDDLVCLCLLFCVT